MRRPTSPHVPMLVLAALVVACGVAGCHRGYYRKQADDEAYCLIQEKANSPHWALPRQTVDVDPRSRMFDPFDPDHPPMPPDDPASHELMHVVDNRPGYPSWHANGDTPFVENPAWRDTLPFDDRGVLPLTSDQAYRLALIHSPDYQRQFETLYLSALDVSAERFRFDSQFFGGYSVFYTASGRERGDGRSELALDTFTQQTGRLGLPAGGVRAPARGDWLWRRSFITGADLVVGLANSLVWDFAGPDEHSAMTLLDFSLVQPLLRQAGRDRILEQLTLAERALLANVRQMERYRRAFFVEIMTGRDAGQGATRRGGFFGGSGLEGFSGVGSGGFGQLGRASTAISGGTGAAQAGGYLGLLQDQQDIRNQQVTIVGLRNNLVQLRDSLRESLATIPDDPETILRERLQIAQARQALLNAESRLLNSQAAYQTRLDQFKGTLGLPPDVCVEVTDPLVEPFNLIDPQVLAVQNEVTTLRGLVGDLNEQLFNAAVSRDQNGDRQTQLPWNDDVARALSQLKQAITRLRAIRRQVLAENIQRANRDVEQLHQALPGRQRQLQQLREKYRRLQLEAGGSTESLDPCQESLLADIDPAVFDDQRLKNLPSELTERINRIREKLEAYDEPLNSMESQLDRWLSQPEPPDPAELYDQLEREVIYRLPSELAEFADDLLDLSLVQARARADAIALTPVNLDWQTALELAREYRRDWMNARAALVDAWRLIEFNADNLESTLDVVFEGDIGNVGDNPVRLRDVNGQLRVGLRFDAPITRLQERNTYRQALIEYQQARRNYYTFVDAVTRGLRATLRTVDLNQVNFEERRIAVLSAIDQVVLNDQIQKLREERGQESGVTAARDVVSALADLQDAQNDFLSVWINYEVQRLNLDLDLGTMRLDPEGRWIDPGPIGPDYGIPVPDWATELSPLPEGVPELRIPEAAGRGRPVAPPREAETIPPGQALPPDSPARSRSGRGSTR